MTNDDKTQRKRDLEDRLRDTVRALLEETRSGGFILEVDGEEGLTVCVAAGTLAAIGHMVAAKMDVDEEGGPQTQ